VSAILVRQTYLLVTWKFRSPVQASRHCLAFVETAEDGHSAGANDPRLQETRAVRSEVWVWIPNRGKWIQTRPT
jgi:hypothetical protein